MSKNSATEVMVKIVDLLTPLPSDERTRAIRAAMIMLGETAVGPVKADGDAVVQEEGTIKLQNLKAKNWVKQNQLTEDQLLQVFHIEGDAVQVIASDVPGTNSKEKTLNAYIILGAANLLASGEPCFDEKSARELCKALGCLNESNHAAYLKAKGNEFTGAKDKGWTLTAPGLKKAATLVAEISK